MLVEVTKENILLKNVIANHCRKIKTCAITGSDGIEIIHRCDEILKIVDLTDDKPKKRKRTGPSPIRKSDKTAKKIKRHL